MISSKLLLSSSYFPSIEYFVCLLKYSKVIIDEHETYPKQTWRNRCEIVGGNGSLSLSIPVERPLGNHTKTSQVLISNHVDWRRNHLTAIRSAYRSSPFFIYYIDWVESVLCNEELVLLVELNRQILKMLKDELKLKIDVEYAADFVEESIDTVDMRFCISPKAKDRKNHADIIFPEYYQVFDDKYGFVSGLSILDLMFNIGPDTASYLKEVGIMSPKLPIEKK